MQDTAESIALLIFRARSRLSKPGPVSRSSAQALNRTDSGSGQTGRKAVSAVVYGCFKRRRTCHRSQFENIRPLQAHRQAKNGEILSYTH